MEQIIINKQKTRKWLMEIMTGFIFLFLIVATNSQADEFVYGDYVEVFKTNMGTIYIYKSSLQHDGEIIHIKSVEVKNRLNAPEGGKGEPYIAIKYNHKYNCSNKKHAGGPTEVLHIEEGWVPIYPKQVREAESKWGKIPDRGTFLDMLPMFCKK